MGTPRDAFGSLMLTNIGSLGLDLAFAPIVPYSAVPILIALGSQQEKVISRNGKIEAIPIVKLCATFDHRLIDGVHAAKMSKCLDRILENPREQLK